MANVLSRPEAVEGEKGGEVATLEEPRTRADDEAVGGNGEGALRARRQRRGATRLGWSPPTGRGEGTVTDLIALKARQRKRGDGGVHAQRFAFGQVSGSAGCPFQSESRVLEGLGVTSLCLSGCAKRAKRYTDCTNQQTRVKFRYGGNAQTQ